MGPLIAQQLISECTTLQRSPMKSSRTWEHPRTPLVTHAHTAARCTGMHNALTSCSHVLAIIHTSQPSSMHPGLHSCITILVHMSWPLYTHHGPHTCIPALVHMLPSLYTYPSFHPLFLHL